jgi:hypothetical protein
MKHAKTNGIVQGAWIFLLLVAMCGGLHAWQVDVFVNGSEEGATMSFGVEELKLLSPMPPYSGMYGVVDVYLANPDGVYPDGVSDAIKPWYNRLSVDIKTAAPDNRWVLVAGSNARLTWKAVEGSIPANFNIAWTEKGAKKSEAVLDGATLSVKTGITYTLGVGVGVDDIQQDPNNVTQTLGKDEAGDLEPAVIALNMPALPANSYTLSINLNAGTTLLAFPVYEAGLLSAYRPNDGGDDIPVADIKGLGYWIVEVIAPGFTVEMVWDAADPNVLLATLSKNGTRADEDWMLSLQPSKGGLDPIQADAKLTQADGADIDEILGSLIAIIQQLGTLDFDGNGVANMDDVMFLYNYASWGFISAQEGEGWFTGSYLLPYTENATEADANAALAYFQENLADIDYDGNIEVDMDDVMYLYNFASWGFISTEEGQGWFTGSYLLPYTENADEDAANQALGTIQDLVE